MKSIRHESPIYMYEISTNVSLSSNMTQKQSLKIKYYIDIPYIQSMIIIIKIFKFFFKDKMIVWTMKEWENTSVIIYSISYFYR